MSVEYIFVETPIYSPPSSFFFCDGVSHSQDDTDGNPHGFLGTIPRRDDEFVGIVLQRGAEIVDRFPTPYTCYQPSYSANSGTKFDVHRT